MLRLALFNFRVLGSTDVLRLSILGAAVGAVALIPPTRSGAANTPGHGMYVCRTAESGETPDAKLTDAGTVELVCRPVSVQLKASNGSLHTIGRTTATHEVASGPDLSNALTPAQINDAYVKFIERTFHIDHTS